MASRCLGLVTHLTDVIDNVARLCYGLLRERGKRLSLSSAPNRDPSRGEFARIGSRPAMTDRKGSTLLAAAETDRVSTPGLRGALRAFVWAATHIEEIVTAILLGIMLGSIGLSVFCRYALKMPLSWTEEVVLLCMVWVVFLGASMATKHKEHIVIDVLLTVFPERLARAMEILTLSVVSAVLALLVWQGILLVEVTQDVATTALGIPTMYIYAAVPTSALLMFIHNCQHLVSMLRHR